MTDVLAEPIPIVIHELPPRERWRPSRAGVAARLIVLLGIGAFILASPHLIGVIRVNVLSTAATSVIVALSLNILIGYTGQVSLGHSAFLGMGAFTAGFVITTLELPWEAAVVASVLVGAGQALVIGVVALRVRGLYLALVTLVYAVFAERVLFNIEAITGGGGGIEATRPGWAFGDTAYAYLCIAAVAVVWLFDWRLTSSKAGRAIEALRDSERVAASWGINVTGFKLLAFVLSGAIAGLAGALFASVEQLISPLDFAFLGSVTFVMMAIFGGVGSRPGVVLGALIFSFLAFGLERFAEAFPDQPINASATPLVAALLVLIVLLYFPGGLAQLLRRPFRWLSFRPWRETEPAGGGE
ncbi:MAG: branched-chain amino acid ABC transporter permease [Nitriliruptorales bacterium]|nr:branched-chain amino acid ABC transporter permease [Nitriliruptorales bacterium]